MMVSRLLQGAEELRLPIPARPWFHLAGVGYALLLVVIGLELSRWGQNDLEAFSPWPRDRYIGLAHPLGRTDRDPRLAALSAVTKLSRPDEPILVFPIDCQFYALTRRLISGRHSAYYARLFDSPRDRERNLEAIRQEMPKLVIVPSDFATGPGSPLIFWHGKAGTPTKILSISSANSIPVSS